MARTRQAPARRASVRRHGGHVVHLTESQRHLADRQLERLVAEVVTSTRDRKAHSIDVEIPRIESVPDELIFGKGSKLSQKKRSAIMGGPFGAVIASNYLISANGALSIQSESVSFTSVAGDQSSFRTVPTGKTWILQSCRGLNNDTVSRNMEFLLVDQDGTTHVVFGNKSGAHPVSIATGGELGWDGRLVVPSGWRVYTKWFALATGIAGFNWQHTAIEVANADLERSSAVEAALMV